MAIFHFQANAIQRSKGRSSVAAAAYRSGSEIEDERTGLAYDYTQKKGVGPTFLVGWTGSRESLWNAAEAAEKRKDATTAREYVVALPRELDDQDKEKLAKVMAMQINRKYGVAVDVCLHDLSSGNPHAHIMTTTREVDELGQTLGAKSTLDISNADRKKRGLIGGRKTELEALKKDWCKLVNHALELRGFDDRIDHRSLKKQGIDREPTIKTYGNPERIKENEAIKQRNREREEAELELADLYLELHLAEQEEQAEEKRRLEALADKYDQIVEDNKRYADNAEKTKLETQLPPSVSHLVEQASMVAGDEFERYLSTLEQQPDLIKIRAQIERERRDVAAAPDHANIEKGRGPAP